jgi:hypothetical protein
VNPRYVVVLVGKGLTNAFGFRSLAAWAQPVAALTASTQGFRSTETRLDMSLIRAKATTCEVEYVVFIQLLAVDCDVCAKRVAKFEANGKSQIDHAVPQPGSLSRASVKSLPHLQVSSPPYKSMYTLGWIRRGGTVCSSLRLQCVRGAARVSGRDSLPGLPTSHT